MVAEARTALLGRIVELVVTDPWEFGTQHGTGPFRGRVIGVADTALAIRLEKSITFAGVTFDTVVALPRLAGASFAQLLEGRKVGSNATPVRASDVDPFVAAEKWRAWHLIASVRAC